MRYGPYICIGVVLSILFVLWVFCGGKPYDFIGLAPLSPETCGSYTGSIYTWGNITPAIGYDPIEGHNCVPTDVACAQESEEFLQTEQDSILQQENVDSIPPIIIDNTPVIPSEFSNSLTGTSIKSVIVPVPNICPRDEGTGMNFTINQVKLSQNPIIQPNRPISSQNPIIQPNRPVLYQNRGRFISRGERLCCQTMERIYGVPFNTIRPDWLRNPETGLKLELDCYNDDLKIAVEYNGEQHYKWPNFTNQSHQQFINQIRRDTFKMDLCDRNGVYLIVVPYNVTHENIPSYIMSHLPETIRKRLQEERTLSNITGR